MIAGSCNAFFWTRITIPVQLSAGKDYRKDYSPCSRLCKRSLSRDSHYPELVDKDVRS